MVQTFMTVKTEYIVQLSSATDPTKTNQGNLAPSAPKPDLSVPDLPQVPTNSFPPLDNSVGGNSAGGEDVDFDDLSRRFEELKKKK